MTTAYNPGADEDTVHEVVNLGQQAADAGQRAQTGIVRMTTDGLQGSSAEGAQELATAVQAATEASNEGAQYVGSTSDNHGATSTGTDTKFAGLIRG